ncbi:MULTISPECIES: NAD(P)/FAD-dependent oxidoreductase [unclassified Moorena]|uniref:NAD(P)/FAD-dependent oxidoreductase n=1 Tax=unclassified Moorena TaxID=2683338 RepID=UPI0014014628|nr:MULTISPECIES: NAD(P)/FAD-dependent oxidoreductase [unclassified Moorena]NEO11708.1 NAD(P)/FAD-dependent oxidoreductase [Moorena sp. SIO3E8]NEP98277.1 NAD(P)/FAD-dependent oxidoreductase [Moorena sp. SIO3F7]
MSYQKPKIVIIGAGFAGLRAVKNLARVNAEVLLIDRNNYHTFVPLLYQVATGFIPPESVAYPLRKFLRHAPNTSFLKAEVLEIDFAAKLVKTDQKNINYDYLIIATGSQTKFLGVDGAPKYTYPLQTLDDAVALRDRILSNCEQAISCTDEERRKQLLTFTIVGGGATGVELAGALIELITDTLAKDYRELDLKEVKVILIHSGNRLLADFPDHLGDYTEQALCRRGVQIHFNTRVSSVMPGAIELEEGSIIETGTIIWAVGVKANLPVESDKLATARKDQVCVRSTLQLLEHPEVYAVGDVAYVKQDDKPLLGIAPEALQQGTAVASNLKRQFGGLSLKPFNYFNKGTAAIIARNAGVAYLFGRISLKGWLAWLLWLGIHLYYLPGLSNRLTVLGSWIRDYLTGERNVRQIFSVSTSSKLTFSDIR